MKALFRNPQPLRLRTGQGQNLKILRVLQAFSVLLHLCIIGFIPLVGFPLFLLMLLWFPGLVFNIVTLPLLVFSTFFLVPITLALGLAIALRSRPEVFARPAYGVNPQISFRERIRTRLPRNPEIQNQIRVQDTVGFSKSICSVDGKQIMGTRVLCVGCGRTYHSRCANWLKANGRHSCSCGEELP